MKSNILKKLVLLICVLPVAFTSCKDDEDVTPAQVVASIDKVFDGNAVLSSQAQVNDFAAENYNTIDGDLLIGFNASSTQMSDITSLSQLTSIRAIGGKLNISNNPILSNIEGLNALNFIRGLEFRKNAIITTLSPLVNVLELTFLQVEDNDALKNMEGLSGVANIQQYAIVRRNADLLSLNGLNNLEAIEDGQFSITESPLLTNISALSNLKLIGGTLSINFTPLTSLNGLSSVESLGGDMFFSFNTQLNDYCALNNLIIQNTYSEEINALGNAYDPTVQDIIDGNCSN
ncbi:hypothetical protein [Lacinutrix jangbogonensis]|uniref:hypothetical protein n=1 Tax=Lacinutrix jangbogonensis TaxID=1469557 RepID=UPI00053DE22A|nr:hypothetical protein [Lacinutrix jangbogonensis]